MGDPKVLVACTLAAYKALPDRPVMESQAWLAHADDWVRAGAEILAVLQTGQGHDDAFGPLRDRLSDLGASVWMFSVDDGSDEVTTGNRLAGITTGRNLAHEFVCRDSRFTHLLHLDSDVEPPADAITKLTEVRWPMVAGHIPTYCLDGPKLTYELAAPGFWVLRGTAHDLGRLATAKKRFPDDADIREHWSSAGCWMLERRVVNRIRWGWSLDDGETDDPWTADLGNRLGFGPMWTRHDCVCVHHPQSIGPLEGRGHNLQIVRP